ncbi:MAG: hypothetical protein NTX59_07350 [Elusimicrobia bacterium]|nr:hypothetical protein [Elusimicrobiota bacterium]
MTKISLLVILFLAPAAARAGEERGAVKAEALIPSSIPVDKPAQPGLTAELRQKVKTLGFNGLGIPGGAVSRALLLLPNDRARAGIINFEIEAGSRAGVYQCEALGRGLTSTAPVAGWQQGLLGSATVYYAPKDSSDGATMPGVYDLRNISPDRYEIALLGSPGTPEEEAAVLAKTQIKDAERRPFFSGVWRDWYPAGVALMPVDLVWAENFQAGSQGEGVPFFERRPVPSGPASKARQAAQLDHNPKYYYGPYGRSGFAVHTDVWDDPVTHTDPEYAGRPELSDFRWRDTYGCVKLRPGCLALLNEFIAEQAALGRRVQLEVRETGLLDKLP